ncbi:MAG: hypothetical protein JWN37_673 [Candidatus Nomurabacteria bacterium]|nr:hypothetical protein [Candidatus Nomurabacteria bacterium]
MLKTLSVILGVVFVLVGLLGFVGGLGIVGASGFFQTDHIHDAVHLIIGIVILFAATSSPNSLATWLRTFGVIYLILAVVGLISADGNIFGILANKADVWLHVVLGVILLALPSVVKDNR